MRPEPQIPMVKKNRAENTTLSKRSANILPEDVFPFSAKTWQARYGCTVKDARYIGASSQPSLEFAVVRSGKNEHIYMLGETLEAGSLTGRIIWLDSERIIIRNRQKISVLCREKFERHAAKPAHEPSAASALPPVSSAAQVSGHNNDIAQTITPRKVYRSPAGTVATVSDAQGKVAGFRLEDCHRFCWLLKQYSIEKGDVITSVQGVSVADFSEITLNELILAQKNDVELNIEREGQTRTVTLPWKRIAPLIRLIK